MIVALSIMIAKLKNMYNDVVACVSLLSYEGVGPFCGTFLAAPC